jgi:tetratricopeptide (TPR) repeat protein
MRLVTKYLLAGILFTRAGLKTVSVLALRLRIRTSAKTLLALHPQQRSTRRKLMLPISQMPWLVAFLVAIMPVFAVADQTDQRLDALFVVLQTSDDAGELVEVESSIWEIWYQSGQADIDSQMQEAAALLSVGEMMAAESIYARVITQLPMYSEGWNRRATVRFYMGDYEGSLADIRQTLKLEPRHFGAVWGLGMILGLQQDYDRAIAAFEQLLEIKPNSADARPRIESLKQALAKEAV